MRMPSSIIQITHFFGLLCPKSVGSSSLQRIIEVFGITYAFVLLIGVIFGNIGHSSNPNIGKEDTFSILSFYCIGVKKGINRGILFVILRVRMNAFTEEPF